LVFALFFFLILSESQLTEFDIFAGAGLQPFLLEQVCNLSGSHAPALIVRHKFQATNVGWVGAKRQRSGGTPNPPFR